LAANPQPKSQKLLWRLRATSGGRDFSQEDQKDRRERWAFALPPAICCCVARRMARRAIKPSDLLTFV
jgi:hypothetical protein